MKNKKIIITCIIITTAGFYIYNKTNTQPNIQNMPNMQKTMIRK